jgi:hypothetical protein
MLQDGPEIFLKKFFDSFFVFLQQYREGLCLTLKHKNNKAMFDFLMPLSIIGSFGASVYYFTKVITEYILKKKMIEKGYVNEDTQAIFKTRVANEKHASLKWGLLSLSGGVSLILMDYLDVRSDSPLPYGLLAVALSVGFLAYYFVVRNDSPANK